MDAPERIFISFDADDSELLVDEVSYEKREMDSQVEYIRADLARPETVKRLMEAAREFLRVICSNTIQNNESLKAINALKAVLEGEKGAQETSCQATHE